MTIQECINASLQLLNQYSIAGTTIPLTYNDQADDVARMIVLINDAIMEIATTVRPITATESFEVPKVDDNEPRKELAFQMPANFNHAERILYTPTEGRCQMTIEATDYKWLEDNTLLVPNRPAGIYRVEYQRYPAQYDLNTNRNTRLDNTPDTHTIIPYYVAAMVALDDNAKSYYALYNVWETRLSRLNMKPAHATIEPVVDVYGF